MNICLSHLEKYNYNNHNTTEYDNIAYNCSSTMHFNNCDASLRQSMCCNHEPSFVQTLYDVVSVITFLGEN